MENMKEICSIDQLRKLISVLDESQEVVFNTQSHSISDYFRFANDKGIKITRTGFKSYILHASNNNASRKYLFLRLIFLVTSFLLLLYLMSIFAYGVVTNWNIIERYAKQNPILGSVFGGLIVIAITSISVLVKKRIIKFSFRDYLGNTVKSVWKKSLK